MAQQAKKGIEDLFNLYINLLNRKSGYNHIIVLDEEGKREIQSIYNIFSDDIASVTRVDEKGYIVYTFPYDYRSIRRDISYQSHIKEIMKTLRPVVSDVITTVQGFRTIALHVPVFQDGIQRNARHSDTL